jgi:hypothetical protein
MDDLLLSWIKFRGPELNQGSCLQNFSFPSLSSRSESRGHKVSLEPHTETTRKDPDPKKFPGPHLTSLTCVPNFRIKSLLEVLSLLKSQNSHHAKIVNYNAFSEFLQTHLFCSLQVPNLWNIWSIRFFNNLKHFSTTQIIKLNWIHTKISLGYTKLKWEKKSMIHFHTKQYLYVI